MFRSTIWFHQLNGFGGDWSRRGRAGFCQASCKILELFPQGFVPGGVGMGAQSLQSTGMSPTVPFNQIMQMRMMQMMGSHRGGVQYGPGNYTNNNYNNMNGYANGYNNNPGFMAPNNSVPLDPEQVKRDEKRSKVRERAELKRAKDREQAELRKAEEPGRQG